MEGLTINIGWEYFLGIMAALIAIAWYTNGRFTALETSMKWVKEKLNDLKATADNETAGVFSASSPINLTTVGEKWLEESGFKEYLDNKKPEMLNTCEAKRGTNPYEVQQHIFDIFSALDLEAGIENRLKEFAFQKGTSMDVMRRIGAIYFRNLCIDEFEMNREDIDTHAPQRQTS